MAERKRMVLVGPVHPYRGGIAQFTEGLWRGLRRRGHAVEVVTFSRQYPDRLFPGKTQYEDGPAPDGLEAARLVDTVDPRSWWRAAQHVADAAPDVAVFQYWLPQMAPAFGTMARYLRRRGVQVLGVVHNALPHERRPGDRLLSRWFVRACDGLLALSDAVTADLTRLGARAPVRTQRHPVYDHFGTAVPRAAAREALGLAPDAPVLLFFGFVRRYKGLHVLLEAMPRIRAALPDVCLVVAGEFYEDEAPYRALIRRHDLQQHVRLHADYIPTPEVARYFGAADLVVQPYVSATQSGVVQVAYHFDRPVVVTDVGGLAEAVPAEAGLVVPPEDPVALADAVAGFFEAGRADAMAAGVRQVKGRHSWGALLDDLEALVDEARGG